jgi:hypothetical protein
LRRGLILHTQIAREIETGLAGPLVCDRSVPDNYAYLVERFGRRIRTRPVAHWLRGYALLAGSL